MNLGRILVISDSPERKNYIEYHVAARRYAPIWYPNIMAARKAVHADPFSAVIVDLSLPLEPKLDLIRQAVAKQTDATIISIGKMKFLEQEQIFSPESQVILADDLEALPGLLAELLPGD